jgi:hypothetical protein
MRTIFCSPSAVHSLLFSEFMFLQGRRDNNLLAAENILQKIQLIAKYSISGEMWLISTRLCKEEGSCRSRRRRRPVALIIEFRECQCVLCCRAFWLCNFCFEVVALIILKSGAETMPFLSQSWLNRIFASSCSRLRLLASSSLGNVNMCCLLYLFGCRCSVSPKLLLLRQEPLER